MSNDEFKGTRMPARGAVRCRLGHSLFVLRPSSFRRAGCLILGLFYAAALAGCRGTALDRAKGRPLDSDTSSISSDYEEHKEPTGWARLAPENWGKELKKSVGLGPNKAVAEQAFEEGLKQYKAKNYDAARKQFAKAADRWPDSAIE